MGFNIGKAFTRAVGIPDKYRPIVTAVAVPFVGPTQLAVAGVQKLVQSVSASHSVSPGVQQIHENVPQPTGQGNVLQPTGPTYIYGGGGGGYQPDFYGGSPWDYSTQLTPSSQPQSVMYPVYSPAPTYQADRTWEALTLGLGLFL